MAGDHYRKFIEEAYIEPIRSVLIVDDDFPTYAEILNADDASGTSESPHSRKTWRQQRERVASLIRVFRERKPPLLVDIHDGVNVASESEVETATHLHQCDLLVLDYELDRDKPRDGTRAIEIIRALMANDHFNLVVIYTKEDLDVVFDAVRWGLVAPSMDSLSEAEMEESRRLIDEGEDAFQGFEGRITDSIAAEQYFHARTQHSTFLRTMVKSQQPYTLFASHADRAEWSRDQRKLVLRYLLMQLERSNGVSSDSTHPFVDLKWSSRRRLWIKSSSAFVALSKKTDDEGDLLSDLTKALVDWGPKPSRLFLTRLRTEMDEYGVAAQAPALSNHHALAYWYHELLADDAEENRRWRIAESVRRHSDQLMQAMLPRVEGYAKRLIEAEVVAGDANAICEDHFGVNLNEDASRRQAALEHNAFVCSMDPAGWHLTTGHVFSMSDELWLCLSPACDMVPSQIPSWRIKETGERLPFVGIQLHNIRPDKALANIHSNRFVFLRIDGKVNSFCFNDPSGKESVPHWQILYAEKRGRFSETDFRFTASHIRQGKTRLVSKRLQAHVVGQLRYEYALNLIQKLGVSLTRVGLDFSDGTGPAA